MENVNVITIEKNVPMPALTWGRSSIKYNFIDSMEVLDSFCINGNTPSFKPLGVKAYVYGLNSTTEKTFTIRTLEGNSGNPTSIRVWRIR